MMSCSRQTRNGNINITNEVLSTCPILGPAEPPLVLHRRLIIININEEEIIKSIWVHLLTLLWSEHYYKQKRSLLISLHGFFFFFFSPIGY